jgi:adenine-specific DNA-methyltransferase
MPKNIKTSTPKPTKRTVTKPKAPKVAKAYEHRAENALRPDVGTQAQFKKKKAPKSYRYDSSLAPALDWDGQNPAREKGEALIAKALDADTLEEAKSALSELKSISKPFLNWAGKAERLSFDVPTLPLFVHERLSTKAIIETLKGHRRDKDVLNLFGDEERSISDQILKAYSHTDNWTNRMILGDSLVVMNSLLEYESLGGQVQMIYMDPPYGVKFGSNFMPFVRKRDVKHNEDEDMTREPEMVKAYRDTWELGLHSYLTYLRDRLLMARDLLSPSGSLFVQISDENVHYVREVMDEVFGVENFCGTIAFRTTTGKGGALVDTTCDYLLWFGKDKSVTKFRQSYVARSAEDDDNLRWIELPSGDRRRMTMEEANNLSLLPNQARIFRPNPLTSQTASNTTIFEYQFENKLFKPGKGGWKTNLNGMKVLNNSGRLMAQGNTLCFIRYLDDFSFKPVNNVWDDTRTSGFTDPKSYVVQTNNKVVQRCLQMTTDPGDLVLDPTCGSGTTAFVAEQWGRRWITIDTSRVPLALARQRMLTATFPFYELLEERRGPASGLVYKRKQNKKGEEVGGIVPHVTLKSIANNEPPEEEVLVDRPEQVNTVTRVSGPFCFEATIPTPMDWATDEEENPDPLQETYESFSERMLEVLRRSPVLHLAGGKTVKVKNVRRPVRSLSLSAEAEVDGKESLDKIGKTLPDLAIEAEETSRNVLPLSGKYIAFVFGPENGAVSEKLVHEAAKEANLKQYSHLYVIGFAIQPNARNLIENCDAMGLLPATYVQATPDLMMGDLLKNMRSSQIFSVCGLPEIAVRNVKSEEGTMHEVELLGLDVFDPIEMVNQHRDGDDVPAWFLDTNYNGLCFRVSQAFFPRTGAWDNLKKALKSDYDEGVWDHLAGSVSAPFELGEHKTIAVKVIDDRGNELMVVKEVR